MKLAAAISTLINRSVAARYLRGPRDPADKALPLPEEVIRRALFISIITLLRSRDARVAHPSRLYRPVEIERAVAPYPPRDSEQFPSAEGEGRCRIN